MYFAALWPELFSLYPVSFFGTPCIRIYILSVCFCPVCIYKPETDNVWESILTFEGYGVAPESTDLTQDFFVYYQMPQKMVIFLLTIDVSSHQ